MFSYSASGGLILFGCGRKPPIKKTIALPWKEGDTAWLLYEAKKGRLRNVFIKKVRMFGSAVTFGQINILYQDNENALYNPEDLITNEDAIIIAMSFYQKRAQDSQTLLNSLTCTL